MNKELEQIMSMTVENLAKTQHDALKEHAISVLDNIKRLIQDEEYDKIEALTFYSDCGDGWGKDSSANNVINFAYTKNGRDDIVEVVDWLKGLKNVSSK